MLAFELLLVRMRTIMYLLQRLSLLGVLCRQFRMAFWCSWGVSRSMTSSQPRTQRSLLH